MSSSRKAKLFFSNFKHNQPETYPFLPRPASPASPPPTASHPLHPLSAHKSPGTHTLIIKKPIFDPQPPNQSKSIRQTTVPQIRPRMTHKGNKPTCRCSQFHTETWSEASAVTIHGCVGCTWIFTILSGVGRNARSRSISAPLPPPPPARRPNTKDPNFTPSTGPSPPDLHNSDQMRSPSCTTSRRSHRRSAMDR